MRIQRVGTPRTSIKPLPLIISSRSIRSRSGPPPLQTPRAARCYSTGTCFERQCETGFAAPNSIVGVLVGRVFLDKRVMA